MHLINKTKYIPVAIAVLMSACATQPITHFDDPTNTYNAQTTYQKLKGDYPFINIASTTPSANN